MYRTDQKDVDKEEEQLPDEVVSQQMSSREEQSYRKLENDRHRWTDEKNESVISGFETAIKEKAINIQTVKDIIQEHKILSKIDASKVFDKVRSFIKEAESRESEQALPTETETQRENFFTYSQRRNLQTEFSSVVSHKGGMTFTDDQTEIYWRLFRDLIVSTDRITQHYVKTKIEEDEEAREAIVGFTPQQLVDNIPGQSAGRLRVLKITKK